VRGILKQLFYGKFQNTDVFSFRPRSQADNRRWGLVSYLYCHARGRKYKFTIVAQVTLHNLGIFGGTKTKTIRKSATVRCK